MLTNEVAPFVKMAPLKTPKGREARFKECNAVLVKMIEEIKIPEHNPSVRLLNVRMSKYIDEGRYAEDRIPLVNSDRYILYKFPKWAHEEVEVVLRVSRIMHAQLPAAMEAELGAADRAQLMRQMEADIKNSLLQPGSALEDDTSSHSATQSGPVPASPTS